MPNYLVTREELIAVATVTDPVLSALQNEHGVMPVVCSLAWSLIHKLGIEDARKVLEQVNATREAAAPPAPEVLQ